MRTLVKTMILSAVFGFLTQQALAAPNSSQYTNMDKASCKTVTKSQGEPGSDFTWNCPSRDDFSIQLIGGDSRSWLSFARIQSYYDSRADLAKLPGFFPNVSGTKLEWRYKGKKLIGWIYRVSTSNDSGKSSSLLVVQKFNGLSSCILGHKKTNQAARDLIDSATKCP